MIIDCAMAMTFISLADTKYEHTPEFLTYNQVNAREILFESKRIIINRAYVVYLLM